ncbi:hypothetical protein SprV_0401625800 [Sparganum proliferum]
MTMKSDSQHDKQRHSERRRRGTYDDLCKLSGVLSSSTDSEDPEMEDNKSMDTLCPRNISYKEVLGSGIMQAAGIIRALLDQILYQRQTEATEDTKSLIQHQVSSLLMARRPREVLSKVERDALRDLKADKNLVIMPAHKGRATVVLDKTDYLHKAKGAITPTDIRMARPQDTALARFYGLPKVHEDGAPLRPIVSLKGAPTYGLAKWLFWRLQFLTAESDTTVSSSTQFLEKLKGDLAIETIELLLQSKYDETENRLGHAQILQLLKLCLRTYFTFDGTIYEQVKGTPMGSPISGLIAEGVLQRLEWLVFQHHRPKFWARYVDDTFKSV